MENVPLQWASKFELYYPDLPGFPIVYVHFILDGTRVYGFPATVSFLNKGNQKCDASLGFISNIVLDDKLKGQVKLELENRFGVVGKFGLAELKKCCNKNSSYEEFFEEIWKYTSRVFGDEMPYGQFYEKFYSIVRFVSAWSPKTGRQSEMRMLYNFLSIFGVPVPVTGDWKHLHFFLLPTYDEIKREDLQHFEKFGRLYKACKKIWPVYFTKSVSIQGKTIMSMVSSWPQSKDEFISKEMIRLVNAKTISGEERHEMERLVDAFNRYPPRAAFFVWGIMSIQSNDYDLWDKKFFIDFYVDTKTSRSRTVGISQKVVACYLQQGFAKEEIIPIDTWVDTFHRFALGIEDQKQFFGTFSEMGKLERVIWSVAQAKKTNITAFFDMLWCIRYGDTGNNEYRGANPLSCFECKLRNKCPSYKIIKDRPVLIKNGANVRLVDVMARKNVKGKKIDNSSVIKEAEKNGCAFICLTENRVPKKIFVKKGTKNNSYWKLIDEFSGYILKDQKHVTKFVDKIVTTDLLVKDLGTFEPEMDDVYQAEDE